MKYTNADYYTDVELPISQADHLAFGFKCARDAGRAKRAVERGSRRFWRDRGGEPIPDCTKMPRTPRAINGRYS